MDKETQHIITSTIPALEEHGLEIVNHFYKNLFREHPGLRSVFNMSHINSGEQPQALALSLLSYARNCDQPENMKKILETAAHKHCSTGVMPSHYPLVISGLIESMQKVLSLGKEDKVIKAWEVAGNSLAALMTDLEDELDPERKRGKAWQKYRIIRLIPETSSVVSLYLSPADGRRIPDFSPGQYISIDFTPPGTDHSIRRQYSLSHCWHPEFIRISIKKETSGEASGYAHSGLQPGDLLSCSAPAGEFIMQETDSPVVFMSGGIGLTPLLAMAQTLKNRKALWIHGTDSPETCPFREELSRLSLERINFYRDPAARAPAGENWFRGFVDPAKIREKLPLEQGHFYICGPAPFMKVQINYLKEQGVDDNRIHYEYFGSLNELLS